MITLSQYEDILFNMNDDELDIEYYEKISTILSDNLISRDYKIEQLLDYHSVMLFEYNN